MKLFVSIGVLCVVATTPVGAAASAPTPEPADSASYALFEGEVIDLRQGWGDARACTTDGIHTTCFRTEHQLDKFLGDTAVGPDGSSILGLLSSCSTALKLYANASYVIPMVNITTQGLTNLSGLGFDNQTSSYKVGACNSTFYEGANQGGSIYPGNTSAGAQSASMVAGWDNRVSSVVIS